MSRACQPPALLVIAAFLGAWSCGVGTAEPGGPNDSGPPQTPPDGGDAGSAGGGDAGSDAGGALSDGGPSDAGPVDAGPALTFAAILSGADEVPVVATNALGAAAFSLTGRNLAYRLSHIVQSPTAVQIRAGAQGGTRVTLTPVAA